jgi:hypothetical protein
MSQATPEQNREVRHRRKVINRLSLLIPVSGFLGAIFLHHYLGPKVTLASFFIGGLFLFVGFMIFTVTYFRCPICGHPFGSGMTINGGKRCADCNTTFEL